MILAFQSVRSSRKKSEGFSLIEVMVAMLLVIIVMLALMEAVTLYIQSNMRNILRDEAVRMTQDIVYDMRSRGFTSNPVGTTTKTVNRTLRSGTWPFTVSVVVTNVPAGSPDDFADHKTIAATTTWVFLGQTYKHTASAMMPKL